MARTGRFSPRKRAPAERAKEESIYRPLLFPDGINQNRGYRLNSRRDRCRNIVALVNGVQDALENDGELGVVIRLSGLDLPQSPVEEEAFCVT
jgi:hypothetical protein